MNHRFLFTARAAALLGAVLASPSFAADATVLQASAALTNLQYKVHDLNWFDFRKATFTIDAGREANGVYVNSGIEEFKGVQVQGSPFATAVNGNVGLSDGDAAASRLANTFRASAKLTQSDLEGQPGYVERLVDPDPHYGPPVLEAISSYSRGNWAFTLSPYSSVTITGNVDLKVFSDASAIDAAILGDLRHYPLPDFSLNAGADVRLWAPGWGEQAQSDFHLFSQQALRLENGQFVVGDAAENGSLTKAFTLTLTNRTKQTLSGELDLLVNTGGSLVETAMPTVVPEPGTMALQALGLAALGLLCRRGRRAPAG